MMADDKASPEVLLCLALKPPFLLTTSDSLRNPLTSARRPPGSTSGICRRVVSKAGVLVDVPGPQKLERGYQKQEQGYNPKPGTTVQET